MNLLFICSRNQWRSRTAETIFRNHGFHQIKSAGTAASARIRVNTALIQWADLIFVMEYHHKDRIKELFRDQLRGKQIIVLDIPDDYQYMDEELIDLLKAEVSPYLENHQ